MYADEAKTVGRFLRKTRTERGLSLEVVAGLAGISFSHLSRVERGEAVLDRMTHIEGVADALGIALSEILRLPSPMPGNGGTDRATVGVRRALDAVILGRPDGEVLPVRELQDRVATVHKHSRWCRFVQVREALPRLVRDLHTTIDTGRDLDVLLPLAVLLHVHVTRMFLSYAGAPIDLRRQTVFLARDLARRHDTATSLGMATFGVADVLIQDGAFELAQAELNDHVLPPVTVETVGLVCGTMAATQALLVAIKGGDADAVLAAAAEIAEPFGEVGERDPLGFGFGPTNVGLRCIGAALELGDHDRAVHLARSVQPEANPFPASQAFYWTETGRALARVRGQFDNAVIAYRKAEDMFPVRLYRDPRAREVISGLLTRARHNAMGEELQGLAGRLGISPSG